ncbi:MAG: Uma2 family endonuclease [Gemmatimonadales bacterium]
MPVRLLKGRFTVEDYHRLAEVGVLGEDDRVELLDGQIVEMSPIGPRHAGRVKNLARLLYRTFGDAILLGIQDPVVLGAQSEPEPDVAVLVPRADAYGTAHPGPADIRVVIEVADTSLAFDREVKVPLYAAAGIPEAWLVDLASDVLEVHRQPGPEGYREVRTLSRGETLAPLFAPTGAISVDEVLGPRP